MQKYENKSILRLSFFVLIWTLLSQRSGTSEVVIPLAYALDPQSERKYPIKLSFNNSQTITPFKAHTLPLYNLNLSLQTKFSYENDNQQVIIGLKNPSSFLSAVQETFKVEPRQIQFGKDQYTQLIINGNNFVESTDEFVNGQMYSARAMYNFGDPLYKSQQRCYLIDDEDVYFDEMLILEILNSMQKRNNIHYVQDQTKKAIQLQGSLQNFPKISFIRGKSIFELSIKKDHIFYVPRVNSSESVTYIGYKAFQKFSKFEINQDKITFKRTSQLYQLYLFLGYFFIFTLLFIIFSKVYLEDSMKFVKSVVDWIVFHNRQARLRVLRTQLQ